MTITIRSSTLSNLADPVLGKQLAPDRGHAVKVTVQKFIEANRDVLMDYWDYKILTDEMEPRLKKV
jgi:hypothetical protein